MTEEAASHTDPAQEIAALRGLLRDVTEQRDKLLSQYEAMALQVDESTRQIDDALVQAKDAASRAEASERHALEEEARADGLAGELDAERRRNADLARELETERRGTRDLAAECERLRREAAQIPSEEHPLAMLSRGSTLLVCEAVAWVRAKIPPDSSLLPWYDRLMVWIQEGARMAAAASVASWRWLKPHLIELWKTIKGKAREWTK